MAKHRIRITGSGIHGKPTEDNPTGEYSIGHEFDTDADLPAGWKGRAEIVGEEPAEGAEFIANEQDARALQARAERAEAGLQKANEQIEALNLKLQAFDHDGDGNPGGGSDEVGDSATADEITAAIALLDGKDDAHWTAAGLPAVDAVAELTGKHVTRAAITAAAPDAKRPA